MRMPNLMRRSPVSFNMTPLIDVVFLLIIFFLVSSHLAKQEAQMELPLPVADSGEEPVDTVARRLTMNVMQNGNIVLSGRRIDRSLLQQRLEQARQAEQGDLEIRIRSDRNVAYEQIAPVLLACARAGVWNVTFSVFHSQDVR